jgi:hypothetical protein
MRSEQEDQRLAVVGAGVGIGHPPARVLVPQFKNKLIGFRLQAARLSKAFIARGVRVRYVLFCMFCKICRRAMRCRVGRLRRTLMR